MITIVGDYRLAFSKVGQVTGHEIVNIDFTLRPYLPKTAWPLKLGTPTVSLATKHKASCALMNGRKVEDIFQCCACPAWQTWLRKELKANG